jgi:cytosine/adenosine deaminase-related metal-dependent hydrolase
LSAMLFQNPSTYLSGLFQRTIGKVRENERADFAIFPYDPPTPLTQENLMGHLVFGLSLRAEASWVYANGVPVVEDGRVTTVDETAIRCAARKAAERVWKNFADLEP